MGGPALSYSRRLAKTPALTRAIPNDPHVRIMSEIDSKVRYGAARRG